MAVLDVEGDARRAFEVLKNGGTAIIPSDTGYGLAAGTQEAIERINRAKGRGGHKRTAFMSNIHTQREIHRLSPRAQEMVEAIASDYSLPLGVLGPVNPQSALLASLPPPMLKMTTALGKVNILINAGKFLSALADIARPANLPILGSSANLTGTGTKFRVEDIEPEVRAIADTEVDYGLVRFHHYGRASTIIDFETLEVIRFGSCYDMICGIMRRHFGVELPEDPGAAALPNGHTNEFRLAGLE